MDPTDLISFLLELSFHTLGEVDYFFFNVSIFL
jgi:hypothetical protein